ncbi:hypothetical protein RRG08_004239 [Elysia crispata]|uniref:C-type lectin domain-containing protein n=1 Tax=Elysia crispata TaxID=231223 RepID=A0AAE1DEL8_9GAST|nr:hypothetical protein RRG08_004239 [Elysia crispata]
MGVRADRHMFSFNRSQEINAEHTALTEYLIPQKIFVLPHTRHNNFFLYRHIRARRTNSIECLLPTSYTQNLIAAQRKRHTDDEFWIGLNDRKNENHFKWLDGTQTISKNYWADRQPDDNDGNEDCVVLLNAKSNIAKWNDLTCSEYCKFICEVFPDCPGNTFGESLSWKLLRTGLFTKVQCPLQRMEQQVRQYGQVLFWMQ